MYGCSPQRHKSQYGNRNWEALRADRKPVPPLADYEAYQQTINKRAQHCFDPAKVRRIVIMMREGRARWEAGGMIGYKLSKAAYEKMPERLR